MYKIIQIASGFDRYETLEKLSDTTILPPLAHARAGHFPGNINHLFDTRLRAVGAFGADRADLTLTPPTL